MNNRDIAKTFEKIGTLLELKGENPFKSRAYFNAARTISSLPFSLKESIDREELTNIPGIGDALAKKIQELAETGRLAYLERLEREIPQDHIEMLRIPGLGPKKIRKLTAELGINTVGELEYACRENRLKLLPGFGSKSQENILEGIGFLRSYKDRYLCTEAKAVADTVIEVLSDVPGVERISEAGSLRRKMETVGDIDIVVASDKKDREKIVRSFTGIDRVSEVVARGTTKITVRFDNGMACDLRMVEIDEFPYALQHLTGSAEHNTALRAHAKKVGLKLNEYGIFRGSERVTVQDENGFYQTLGMAYIPPELRENTGEIVAAIENRLPVLVEPGDLKGIFHVHTVMSDGSDTIEALALRAKEMGMEYLGIADHSASAAYANGLSSDRVKRQWDEIDAFNDGDTGFYIFKGIESDILGDGSLDYDDSTLGGFDFVIASVHSGFSMSESDMTERIVRAVSHPSVTILGHPTGRLLLGREGYKVDMETVLDACAEHGVAIELNANPHRLDIDWHYLRSASGRGIPVSINPDSHSADTLSHVFTGVGTARKGWLRKEDVFNTTPQETMREMLRK